MQTPLAAAALAAAIVFLAPGCASPPLGADPTVVAPGLAYDRPAVRARLYGAALAAEASVAALARCAEAGALSPAEARALLPEARQAQSALAAVRLGVALAELTTPTTATTPSDGADAASGPLPGALGQIVALSAAIVAEVRCAGALASGPPLPEAPLFAAGETIPSAAFDAAANRLDAALTRLETAAAR